MEAPHGQKLGIEKPWATYVDRHAYFTVPRRSGVCNGFTQEAQVHTHIRTTKRLFENEVEKGLVARLTAFRKAGSD